MNNHWKRICRIACAFVLVLECAMSASAAEGIDFDRDKKQDIYLLIQNLNSKQIDYKTASGVVPIAMDATPLGGIGFGYHFSEKFAFRFETLFGNTTFSGKGPANGTSRYVTMNSGMFNFDWFPVNTRVAPFFTGGFGWQYIEAQLSNIGVPTVYWDPWWGYTVSNSYPVYSETDFVSSLGLGIRWDVTDNFFLKLSADANWLRYVNGDGTTGQVKYGLTVGAAY